MHKTWHKSLHKRKVWLHVTMPGKAVYYMQPLIEHLFEVWMQPLPFPTLLKFLYTFTISFFILLPVIYPLLVLLLYFGIIQFMIENHFNFSFPAKYDLLGALKNVLFFQINNKKYLIFVALYVDRYRIILTAVSSSIDYIRMAFCLVVG